MASYLEKSFHLIFNDHPLPWSADSEVDETLPDTPDDEAVTARAYSAEPVVRDARNQVVFDTRGMEELGPYGRMLFAEWMVDKANAEKVAV